MPSLYPSMAYTNITASFRIPSDDVNPPYIEHFDMPVSYYKGEEFNISIEAKDDKQLGSVKAQYYDDAWREIALTNKEGRYTGKISTSLDKIDLRIILDDNSQNSIIYTFTNISFAKEELGIELYTISGDVYPGGKIQFRGRVTDTKRKGIYLLSDHRVTNPPDKIDIEGKTVKAEPSIGEAVIYVDSESALLKEGETKEINGLSITLKKSEVNEYGYAYVLIEVDYSYVPKLVLNYFINDEFVSKGATKSFDHWDEIEIEEKRFGKGEFTYDYTIPFDYAPEKLDFSVQFDGAGIYMPQREDITIDAVKYDHDIAVSGFVYGSSENGALKRNNLTTFNATIYNVGSKTEKDIPINFAINGEIIDTRTIEQLEPAESVAVSFSWTPTEPGSYDISIEIDYAQDDNPDNDKVTAYTTVSVEGPNIYAYIDGNGKFIVNQSNSLSLTIYNIGTTTATNMEATVYDLFEYEYAYLDYGRTEKIDFNNTEYELEVSIIDDEFAIISVSYNGITEEFNLSKGSLRRLSDGVLLVIYQIYDNYVYAILGKDSSISEASLPDLQPNSVSENEISTKPTTLGYHLYYVFVNATADIDWSDNYNIDEIKVVRDEADIEVWLDIGYSIAVNQTTEIPIYISNRGSKTATNINATFYDLYDYEYLSLYYDFGSSTDFDGTTYNILATRIDDERAELKVSYDETEKDAVLREGEALEIGNGAVINVLYIMDDSAEAVIAKALPQKINLADLEPDGKAEETIEWTAETQGPHILTLFADTTADGDWSNNNYYGYVDVKAEGPDARGWIDYSAVIVNQQNNITAWIINEGTQTATDVTAYLYLLNTTEIIIEKPISSEEEESSEEQTEEAESFVLIDSVYIGDLEVNEGKTIIFNWTPENVGYHNLKLIINATSDVDLTDNEYYTTLYVGPDTPDLKASLYLTSPVALQKPADIGVNLQNRGTKAEGITSKLYDGSTLLDTRTIEELGSGDWYWYSYEWAPQTKGMHTIKVVAEVANDYNSSDNSYSKDVEVLSIINATFNITNYNKEPVEKYLIIENPAYYGLINAPTEIEILERTNVWLADVDKDEDNGIGTMFQSSIAKPDMNAISEYYIEEMAQDSLLLYAVYANNVYWEYNYSTFLVSAEKNYLKISKLDDIEIFYCAEWDFSAKNCTSGWHKSEFKKDLWGNYIYAEAFADKAEAFAIADFDTDGDSKPDWQDEDDDNDEIPDDNDMLSCGQGKIPSNIPGLELRINNSYNLSQIFNETILVEFVKDNKIILKAEFPFANKKLKCRDMLIEEQESGSSKGYVLVNGLNLTGTTKTLYMDRITAANQICIKDEEVFSIDEMSTECNGENEVLINCDGTQQNSYTCNNLGDRYEITGLKNSAAQEYTPPATPPGTEEGEDEDGRGRVSGREYLSPIKQCFDRRDNDGDGLIDWPEDIGCYSKFDNDERGEEEEPTTTPAVTKPESSTFIVPPVPSEEKPKETENLKLPKEMGEIYGYVALILALTIILGSMGFVFAELKLKKGAKIRKQMQAVQDYAKKELERGFSREDIRNKLLGVGWKKEMVDDIFRKIRL